MSGSRLSSPGDAPGRSELNVYGALKRGSWSAKVYRYQSERGIPGAIVNNVWRRGERVWDTNTFGQARYTGYFGRFTTLANVKYANYHTHYVNNDDRQVAIDNRYRQQEFYLSTANQYEVCSHLSLAKVSQEADCYLNILDS